MPRLPASDRRETMIAATERVLLRKGLLAATTRDVTDELGVGAGLLNHYFTWPDLRATAFERLMTRDLDQSLPADGAGAASGVLKRFVASAFAKEADKIGRLWLEAYDLAAQDREFARRADASTAQWHSRLAALLARGHDDDEWHCSDAAGSSLRIIALIVGLAGMYYAQGSRLSRSDATLHLAHMIGLECVPRAPKSARDKLRGKKPLSKLS
jgi:AcrR family transcriptional regulator